jgi:hypothetical protein
MSGLIGTESKVKELLNRSLDLPEGDERIMMLEEAVRLADTTGDIKLQYEAREDYLEAAYFGGVPEKALVAYVWCLAQYDRAPEMFWEWKILWRYKWMVNVICDFPQISREQIYQMLDDMERRFRESGRGLRAVYKYRYRTEKFFGNREEAIRLYHVAERSGRDDLSDCNACEIDEKVTFNLYMGNDALALRIAEPLLLGREKCRTVPQRTYAKLLVPLLRLGRREDAWDYYLRGYTMVSNDRALLDYLSEHLIFLSLYGEFDSAARILEKHYQWTEQNTNPFERFTFYRAAWVFLEQALDAGEDVLELRLPRSFPLYNPSGYFYNTVELKDWFSKRALELAARFDARNGTSHFIKILLDIKAIKELQNVA